MVRTTVYPTILKIWKLNNTIHVYSRCIVIEIYTTYVKYLTYWILHTLIHNDHYKLYSAFNCPSTRANIWYHLLWKQYSTMASLNKLM